MNEMQVLRRLRDDVPATLPVSHAETVLLTAIRAEGAAPAPPARKYVPRRAAAAPVRHKLRLALAGGVSLALAAGITTAVVISGQDPHPSTVWGPKTSPAVHVLAYHAAKAAGAQPKVPANHWVYWREQNGTGAKAHVWRVWTTANGQRSAYRYHGKVYFIHLRFHKQMLRDSQYAGQPVISFIPPPHTSVVVGTQIEIMPIRYSDLGKLPSDPRALVRYLAHLLPPGSGPPPTRAFQLVTSMLQTYVMPPRLTAELYRALAEIPGVTVDRHAIDVAGRHGVGFAMAIDRGTKQELVINPHSYRLMGVQIVRDKRAHDGQVVFEGGTAILRMALVTGPGVLP